MSEQFELEQLPTLPFKTEAPEGPSPISEKAASNMPETWAQLRKSAVFGSAFIASKEQYVKFRLFGTVANPQDENSFYNPVVQEYAGKIFALAMIGPGIDYWGNQTISVSLKGTDETVSYADRVKMLIELQKRLAAEASELLPLVEHAINLVPFTKAFAKVSPPGEDMTPDPQKFGKEFPTIWPYAYQEVSPWR